MESDSSFNERKCVVVTKESVFYLPEEVQTVPCKTSPSYSNISPKRRQFECPPYFKRATQPERLNTQYSISKIRPIVIGLALLAVLVMLMVEYDETLEVNVAFCSVGVMLGFLLSWFVNGWKCF